ncbi:hypothetical protein MTO96_033516 [Rhipicephalus appendiculatus]
MIGDFRSILLQAMAKGQKRTRAKVSTSVQGRPAVSGVDSLAASTQDEKQPAMAKAKRHTRQQVSTTSAQGSPDTSGLEKRANTDSRQEASHSDHSKSRDLSKRVQPWPRHFTNKWRENEAAMLYRIDCTQKGT